MVIDNLLSKLDKVKSNGQGKWLACCPAHPDKSPSLAIKQTDDGKILIHCFSGCQVSDIVAAVGLELSDLMPENPSYQKGTKPPRFNKYELFDRLAFEVVILSMGIRQLLAKEDLSHDDLSRVILAENTINEIVREVRQ
ncbi:MAG: CHC2 zinc finger domain-containing protein [Methylococcales bacterium]|nr:CHC2 zinc finger domain-containing protein [Methylococcales bacterium]